MRTEETISSVPPSVDMAGSGIRCKGLDPYWLVNDSAFCGTHPMQTELDEEAGGTIDMQ